MNLWHASDHAGRRWALGYVAAGCLMLAMIPVTTWWWLQVLCALVWWSCAYVHLRTGARRAETKRIMADLDAEMRRWMN